MVIIVVYALITVSDVMSNLHIQTGTPAGRKPGLRSSSAGPSASCRTGWQIQSEIQSLDLEPKSPSASEDRISSEGAVLKANHTHNDILILNIPISKSDDNLCTQFAEVRKQSSNT